MTPVVVPRGRILPSSSGWAAWRTCPRSTHAIEELKAAGIVKQVSAGKGNRLYEVLEVFSLLDTFESDPTPLQP